MPKPPARRPLRDPCDGQRSPSWPARVRRGGSGRDVACARRARRLRAIRRRRRVGPLARGGRGPGAAPRPERAARTGRALALANAARPVRRLHDPGADRRGDRLGHRRRRQGHARDRRDRRAQCRYRLHPGIPGRARDGGLAADDGGQRQRAARRRRLQHPGGRRGPRRRRAARSRQHRPGRRAPRRCGADADGRGAPDRRVGRHRQDREDARARRAAARRPPQHRLQGDDRRPRPRARHRGRDGDGHGTRPDRDDARRGRRAAHAIAAAPHALRTADRARGPRDLRHRVRRRAPARRSPAAAVPHGDQPRRRGDPRGAAGRGDHFARPRRGQDGEAPRPHPPPARGRDAGLGHRHLLRQDRHADRQPDGRGGDLRRRRRHARLEGRGRHRCPGARCSRRWRSPTTPRAAAAGT